MWTFNTVINVAGEDLVFDNENTNSYFNLSRGRIKTAFVVLSFAQILVYISTFSTMLLGGYCQPDEAVIPKAMTIMMAIQLLVYAYILFEHYVKYYGIDENFTTISEKQEHDKVMFE